MGYSSNPTHVLTCLGALDAVLGDAGAPIERGVAVSAARRFYSSVA